MSGSCNIGLVEIAFKRFNKHNWINNNVKVELLHSINNYQKRNIRIKILTAFKELLENNITSV